WRLRVGGHCRDADDRRAIALSFRPSPSGHRVPFREFIGMTAHDHDAVERQLGNRYQIIRTLGTGAFGAVYLARERDLHRLVAIKVLRRDRAWSDEERERLLREARTLANL